MRLLSTEDQGVVCEGAGEKTGESWEADYEKAIAYEEVCVVFHGAHKDRAATRNRLQFMRNTKTYLKRRCQYLEESLKGLRGTSPLEVRAELNTVKKLLGRWDSLLVTGGRDPRVESDYCLARHHMMMALLAVEDGSASALIRKVRYMSCADLPSEMDSDRVLYYREHETVHLFYGGEQSPTGEGESPDGRGHGHVVLIKEDEGGYRVDYHRKPHGW